MRWQIEQFLFCDQQQTLSSNEQVQQLEPMAVELLSYFCQHPDSIVSRDELINSVWLGRVVTDSAVNKVVTKLRKHFDDDAKSPRFIATFPKKGYKFIAQVRAIESSKPIADISALEHDYPEHGNAANKDAGEDVKQSPNVDKAKKSPSKFIWLAVAIFLIASAIGLAQFVFLKQTPTPIASTKSLALTRDAGADVFPSLSPDGSLLSYVEVRDNKMRLKVKKLSDESIFVFDHGEAKTTSVGPADWSDDGTQIAYLVTTPESCQFFIRNVQGKSFSEPQLIHNCPVGSYGKIEFTHDVNKLIYTEAEGHNSPYSLFELNRQTGKKRRLAQPELVISGNSQFDLHPTQNKLLISSPDKQQWEGFYELNLDTDELKLLFKLDAYICCGIWSQQGDRVILMGEHPANQLISYGLNGNNPYAIYSGNLNLRAPTRHSNGKDYLFPAGESNQNILQFRFDTQDSMELVTNSVDDRLATFSEKNQTLAFISLATGGEEIWLRHSTHNAAKRLSQFNDGRHYIDLQWRPDGKQLMALSLNEIHLIDATSGLWSKVKLPQREMRAVSFKDNQTVAFSVNVNGKWQINYYHLDTETTSLEKGGWQYAKFSEREDDTLWINQAGDLYAGKIPQKVLELDEKKIDWLSGRVFNIQKHGDAWYWQRRANHRLELLQKKANQSPKIIVTTDSYHFNVSKTGVYYHQSPPQNIDIYRTVMMQ
ncbi:winged helix-turn-helix domain-containing protein [Undibacterium amnicola]|uniref:Winged helix-turn-helix domain-containing protein n=1 Tax=Undibacterium amnicola TaxID=1834038 RepID=A0ABR6XUZ1_9BURK|nr:winged helix-turn-helix domain-containing protein [Undibacterium amnicola]MBC3833282.1 winged helix-turn-helix domain-containing protein [Undibacterium amnicola]